MRSRGWRALLAASCLGGLLVGFTVAPSAAGVGVLATPGSLTDGSLTPPCPIYGDVRICSAEVASWDGSKLDMDLTVPMNAGDGRRHPLIVMLHGLGSTKHEWESTTDEGDGADKWHWNTHWFARHGYYVLTYTARGFRDDGRSAPWQPPTPSFTSVDLPNGTARLKSRDVEARDTQWLAAIVASLFPEIDPNKIAVTGGSYGGGETWVLASQATWTFPNEQKASLPVLRLQVALPKYTWTDLGYSLAPSGHGGGPSGTDLYETSLGQPHSQNGTGFPVGTLKASFTSGFYALANRTGVLEEGQSTNSSEGPINIHVWYQRAHDVADPYDVAGVEDAVVQQVRRGVTEYRSAYYQDQQWAAQVGKREVAIFAMQGWTDDLFTSVEQFRMFKYLKRLDPLWPVAVEVADVGHGRPQNKPETWRRLNTQAWQFLQEHVNGSHRQETTVSSEPTLCANDADADQNLAAAMRVTGRSPETLSNGTLSVTYDRGGGTTSQSGVDDPNGPATDPVISDFPVPVVGQPCRTSPGPAAGGYTAVSEPLPDATTYVGLGFVEVGYKMTGGNTATLNARVWDVAPGGTTLLVTRGTYRIDTPAYDTTAGTVRLPLFGNHWPFEPGHLIRLDLTQADVATFRPSNVATTLEFGPPKLVLPTREAGAKTLAGA